MSGTTNTDPKYVPSAAALEVVGLKVGDIRNTEHALEFIAEAIKEIETKDFQISVTVYVLRKRGVTNEVLAPRFGWAERTISRKYVEGLAILRTQETTRTMSAIRKAALSLTVVEKCTEGLGDSESKIAALEAASVGSVVQSDYIQPNGKEATTEQIAQVLALTAQAAEANAEPATATAFVDAIPQISERVGLVAKEKKRTPSKAGEAGPFAVEYHLKAALKDAQAIAEAASLEYTPTPADVKALMDLCVFLGIGLDLDPETVAAVEALATA
jgi:hypothetical protein